MELIERRLDPIEARVVSKPTPSPDDMLILATLMLYYSDGGFDPTAPLASCGQEGDCFEFRALNLAAAVFKAAGMTRSAERQFAAIARCEVESLTQQRSTSR